MVYYGKLSRGCERCRRQKVRCDQRKPGCGRCERIKAVCPGYRNLTELSFRDESAKTIERIRRDTSFVVYDPVLYYGQEQLEECVSDARSSDSVIIPTTSTSPPDEQSEQIRRLLSLPAPTRHPHQSLDQMATAFFFTNLAMQDESEYNLLASTYRNHSNSAAFLAIEAIGLAGLSNVLRDSQLHSEARRRYGQALTKTNQAIGDPARATSDPTVTAVLLLSEFENMMFESKDQYKLWLAHVKGASALLELRGKEQFSREAGIRLFISVQSRILTDCICRELPVPEAMLEARQSFRHGPIKIQHVSKVSLADAYFRYIGLKEKIKTTLGREPQGTNIQWVVKEAEDIDRDLDVWKLELDPGSNYLVLPITAQDREEEEGSRRDLPPGPPFTKVYHQYRREAVIRVWNKWRILKILLQRLIFDYGPTPSPTCMKERHDSVIRNLSADICLSVPCLKTPSREMSLIWPLFGISQQPSNDNCIRIWALEQLRRINDRIGVRQAGLLAEIAVAEFGSMHTFGFL